MREPPFSQKKVILLLTPKIISKKGFALAFFLLVASTSYSQRNVFYFTAGAKYVEDGFTLKGVRGITLKEEYDKSPLFQFGFGARHGFSKSNWSFNWALSYRYFLHERLARTNDPSTPTTLEFNRRESLNFIGFKIGLDYNQYLGRGADKIGLPFGLQCHFPVFSKSQFSSSASSFVEEQPIFTGDQFSQGIYYGVYFRPRYEFNFSGSRRANFTYGIFLEGDLLFINGLSGENLKFVGGGGLEINYYLKGKR